MSAKSCVCYVAVVQIAVVVTLVLEAMAEARSSLSAPDQGTSTL